MSLFHRHHWEIVSQRFQLATGGSGKWLTEDIALRMMHGVTTTAMRCTECGKLRSRQDYGDIRPQAGTL